MSTPETTATKAFPPTHSRIVASRVMLVIFCLSTVLSVPACWLHSEINDTDRYVRTVAPLASDPAIRTALSNRVTALISGQLDVIVVRGKLIDRDFLVPPLVSLLTDYVNDNVRTFIASDQFPVMWQRSTARLTPRFRRC